jgi:hypothetical protein
MKAAVDRGDGKYLVYCTPNLDTFKVRKWATKKSVWLEKLNAKFSRVLRHGPQCGIDAELPAPQSEGATTWPACRAARRGGSLFRPNRTRGDLARAFTS